MATLKEWIITDENPSMAKIVAAKLHMGYTDQSRRVNEGTQK